MNTQTLGHTTVITASGNQAQFLSELSAGIGSMDSNLIVDLTAFGETSAASVLEYHILSKTHKKRKKSFVVVAEGVDYDEFPESLAVVPTLQEAHDVIEMEEIERDLGF
jgi:6-phosphofructokinase